MNPAFLIGSRICTALVICGMVAGCSGGNGSRANTVPVQGTVTLDGQPFGPGLIELLPLGQADAKEIRMALGRVDSSGKFVMGSYDSDDGAVPGQYTVRLTSGSDDPSMPGPEVAIQDATVTVPQTGAKDLQVSLSKGKTKGGTGLLNPRLATDSSVDL